jgi:hypothetical protein
VEAKNAEQLVPHPILISAEFATPEGTVALEAAQVEVRPIAPAPAAAETAPAPAPAPVETAPVETAQVAVCERQTIHTFAAHLGLDGEAKRFLALLELWYYSWKNAGWDPVILTPWSLEFSDADAAILRKWGAMATRNARAYTMSTFARWLAMAENGGGWMCDADVINYGWRPREATAEITVYAPGPCPCLVSGSAEAYRAMAVKFSKAHYPERSHLSDQTLLQIWKHPTAPIVWTYDEAAWETAELVHWSRTSCGDVDRAKLISRLRKPK